MLVLNFFQRWFVFFFNRKLGGRGGFSAGLRTDVTKGRTNNNNNKTKNVAPRWQDRSGVTFAPRCHCRATCHLCAIRPTATCSLTEATPTTCQVSPRRWRTGSIHYVSGAVRGNGVGLFVCLFDCLFVLVTLFFFRLRFGLSFFLLSSPVHTNPLISKANRSLRFLFFFINRLLSLLVALLFDLVNSARVTLSRW